MRKTSIIPAVLLLFFFLKFGAVLWIANRGFELGDEGWALLNLKFPGNTPPLLEFYKLFSLLGTSLNFSVSDYRLLSIGMELVSVFILSYGVFKWSKVTILKSAPLNFYHFFSICLLGSFLNTMAQGISYNHVTNFNTFTITGCFFYIASFTSVRGLNRIEYAVSLLMGIITGFQLIVKFPAAILIFIAMFSCFLTLLPQVVLKKRVRLAFSYVAGLLLMTGFLLVINGSWETLLDKYHYVQTAHRLTRNTVMGTLSKYVFHDKGTYINFAVFLSVVGISWFLFHRLFRYFKWDKAMPDISIAAALATGCGALALMVRTHHPEFVHPALIYLFCVCIFFPALLLLFLSRSLSKGKYFVPLLLLFFLPFINILGTNVALTLRLPSHAAPLFILLAVLLHHLRWSKSYTILFPLVLGILVIATSVLFVQGRIISPFGISAPMYEQTEVVASLGGLKVDKQTKVFLDSLDAEFAGAGFKEGDPIIAFDLMPGLVYFLGGYSPGSNFYKLNTPEINCYFINKVKPTVKPYIILGDEMPVSQEECLTAFKFPQDFHFIKKLNNPYERMYSYFYGMNDLPYVRLYAPAN